MDLTDEQIDRYARHIVLKEVGGAGQQALLAARVLIVGAGGLLYATNQKGTTFVFKPNPQAYEQVAENKIGESSNATPAISEGQIFIRTAGHLFCIQDTD